MKIITNQIKRTFGLLVIRPSTWCIVFAAMLTILIPYSPKAIAACWVGFALFLPAFTYLRTRNFSLLIPPLEPLWPLVLFIVWLAVSMCHGDDSIAVERWWNFCLITLITVLTVITIHLFANLQGDERQRVQTGFLWGIFLAIILFAVELYADHPFYRKWHVIVADMAVPDYALNRPFATLFVLIWPALMILWQRRWQWVVVLLLIMCAAFSVKTDMDAAPLAIAIGIITWVIANISVKVARGLCLGGFAALVFLTMPISQQFYRADFVHNTSLPSSARHRVEIWNFVSERIAEKPIFGWGMDTSRAMQNEGEKSLFQTDPNKHIIPLHPHNMILQVWLELGAVGLALFFMLGVWLFDRIASRPEKEQVFILPAFTTAIMLAMPSYGIWQMWWFTVLISCCAWFCAARPAHNS